MVFVFCTDARMWAVVPLEIHLHNQFDIHLGADHSIILYGEKVFVLRPDSFRNNLWGQIEYVDSFGVGQPHCKPIFGKMVHDERVFDVISVISTMRGPAFQAVRCLQRAFRRRRYLQWYRESGGWDAFVQVVVAFAECRGRRAIMRLIRKVESFCPGPSWGYVPVPAPAVAEWPGICVPALGTFRLSEVKMRHGRVRRPEQLEWGATEEVKRCTCALHPATCTEEGATAYQRLLRSVSDQRGKTISSQTEIGLVQVLGSGTRPTDA